MEGDTTMNKPIHKQKTTYAGLALILSALLPVFTGMTPEQVAAISTAIGGLGLIFLRQGVNE